LLTSYPHLRQLATPSRSYQVASLPVAIQGRVFGSVNFTFDNAPTIDQDEKNFLLLVARYSGQALERLRLLEAERNNRMLAEAAAIRAGILSRASRAFAEAGSDLSTVLGAIVEQVTIENADA